MIKHFCDICGERASEIKLIMSYSTPKDGKPRTIQIAFYNAEWVSGTFDVPIDLCEGCRTMLLNRAALLMAPEHEPKD